MECGVWPHDRDRTAERMEGVWMGFGPLWRGVGLQHTRGLYGSSVNHWSIKRTPNGTKLDRRSAGGVPRPLGKTRSILRMINAHSGKETRRGCRMTQECRIAKRTTGNMLGCMRRTRMQNEMHMMT